MVDPISIVLEILRGGLANVEIGTEMPPDVPTAPTVMVAQTGGLVTEYLIQPVLTLTCWGEDDPSAYALAIDCVHALSEASEDHPLLSNSEMVSMSRDSWSQTGQSRYMLQTRLTINV